MNTTLDKTISVGAPNELPRADFHYVELNEETLEEDLQKISGKIKKCKNNCAKLDVAVVEANKGVEVKLFLDSLEKISKKIKDTEPIVEGAIQEIIEDVKEQDLEDSSVATIIESAMIKLAKLNIGYQAEKTEKTFGLHDDKYLKTTLARRIADGFNDQKFNNAKSLNFLGLLFIDLDGLKNINELSLGKYQSGDKALQIVANILSSQEFISWAKRIGIELIPAHYHGDEFLLLVDGMNSNVDLMANDNRFTDINGEAVKGISILKYIGEYIRETIKNTPEGDIKEIFDFTNDEQMELVREFRESLPEEEMEIFNENFEYQLSCSYGYSTMRDAIAKIQENRLNSIIEVSPVQAVLKISGEIIETAAKKLGYAKDMGIAERKNSVEGKDRIMEKFYRFVRNRRANSIPEEDAKEIVKVLFEFRDELFKVGDELAEVKEKFRKEKNEKTKERRKRKTLELREEEMLKYQDVWYKNNKEIPLQKKIDELGKNTIKNKSLIEVIRLWWQSRQKNKE